MDSEVQPVTFLVPSSTREPIEVRVLHSGLRMVLVSRDSIHLLDSSWQVPGVYFLLGPSEEDPDQFRAYVGEVGRSTLVQRVKQHAKQKEWWSRALLIASTSDDFNSAEIGWLEGRLYDVLNNAVACQVMNGNRPGDESLPVHERAVLERYVEPTTAALRACGAPPDTADQLPEPRGRRRITRYSESVADLIGARLLKPDTTLQPLRRGVTQTARVLPDGRLDVAGTTYESLSAAAKAASGSTAEPGWDFWGAPSGDGSFVPLAKLRERLREAGGAQRELRGLAHEGGQAVERGSRASDASEQVGGTKMREIAAAAGVSLPLSIFAKYRGQDVEAVVEEDGRIRFGGELYNSPSTAAVAARRQLGYAGAGKAQTNGWVWWSFEDRNGQTQRLNALRQASARDSNQ